MYSILKDSNYLYEIKKSKFYVLLYKINNQDEIISILEKTKKDYKDATHYCYAYILNNTKKASDDGEPSGTAGIPILEVLDRKKLNNILCIVVRYFGGIKLGAGGLIRAYSNSVKDALNENKIVELVEGYEIEIIIDYNRKKEIEYLFKDNIINYDYDEKIKYTLRVNKEDLNKLNNFNYTIIKEILIEK